MKHIFLDTNIFLHFQDFETIDWLDEASASICKLIVPPIVIDELDMKKIGTNKLSSRARKVLNRFEELMEINNAQLKENVFFDVLLNKPQRIVYEHNDLNFDEQDHRLIASIIEFRELNNIDDILLCTNDIGPRLRAKQFNVKALKLSDKYLLPPQDSEEEKKLKKLEQENRVLKSRMPKLALSFSDNQEFLKVQVQEFEEENFDEFRSKMLQEIKSSYPYLEKNDPYENPMVLNTGGFFAITPEQIETYNKRLDDYFVEYENALRQMFEYNSKQKLTFQMELILRNLGNTPAEDIDIHVHFPDGFLLFGRDQIEKKEDFPEPPRKPKNRFDFGLFPIIPNSPINSIINFDNSINIDRPVIKKTNSYDVDFYRKNLKHGYQEDLEILYIVFKNFEEIIGFKIDYEISAANMPDKRKGYLNVSFEK